MINKPRKWWVAGLMSLVCPGLGQVYNGQGRRGFFFLVLLPLVALSCWFWFLHTDTFAVWSLLAPVILLKGCYVVAVADAIATARRLHSGYTPKRYNKIIVYVAILASALGADTLATLYVRANICQAFVVPAGSMKPTLLLGDRFLVDRRPSAQTPRHGEVVAFEYPHDASKHFVKRVLAVGGDTVELRDKIVIVNGEPVREPYAVFRDPNIVSTGTLRQRDNLGPIKVPANVFFVLGDNRDESYDSRFWGFVEQSKIIGTARSVYWSWDRDSNTVRWDRIGMSIAP